MIIIPPVGLLDKIFGARRNPTASRSSLPANAAILGNDLVVAALIGPPGHPVEDIIARAAQGELTPVVLDASLYWALSTAEPGDIVQLPRFAELLRYAHILPSERDANGAGLTPPDEDEKRHWRDVVFDRQVDEDEDESPGQPQLLCSRCGTLCSGTDAHVIPWWNPHVGQVLTTYRCEQCWLVSLEETRSFVRGPAYDEAARTEFVRFLEHHHLDRIAASVAGGPREASIAVLLEFVAQVESQALVLRP